MLRTVLVVASLVAAALGGWLVAQGIHVPGIYLLVVGVAVCVGTLFERWRYRQDERQPQLSAPWQRTGERFEDPQSGDTIEVYFDASSGARRYVTVVRGQRPPP